ncbi:MAG: hypothetical protein QNJ37_04845 [Crocosphaera sp.]|nr:hypothetical protein [Crocosphaera sp.]
MTNDKPEDLFPSNKDISSIIPVDNTQSSLDPVEEILYEKIKSAKTPEETQNFLNLIEQRQTQLAQKKYTNFQLQESQNQINYERKLIRFQDNIAITFSIIAIIVGIGLSFTDVMPLVSPLLIVLGFVKPLGFTIKEVIELMISLSGGGNSEQKSKNEDS